MCNDNAKKHIERNKEQGNVCTPMKIFVKVGESSTQDTIVKTHEV